MLRPGPRLWTTLLLAVGGLLLGFLGFLHLASERERTDDRARALERRRLAQAVADAPRLARQPRGAALRAWEIEPARVTTDDRSVSPELLAAVRGAERPGLAPRASFNLWIPLTTKTHPTWLRHIASYRAGMLAVALRDFDRARELLSEAAQAHQLVVTDGIRVRAGALKELARRALLVEDTRPLVRFLDAARDGHRLARGDVEGPDDLLLALHAEIQASGVPLTGKIAKRLDDAAAHAREGVALLAQVPQRGVALVGNRVVHHGEIELQMHDLESLVAPPPGFPARAHVALTPIGRALGPLSARLAAPLEAVVVTVDREPLQAKSLLALFALALGLGFYSVGALLALRGWRRSREAARMQADFTAAVSHEMKTPIASVRAMAELLGDGEGDPELARRYAGRIESEMLRLGTTVRNVLDAAQVERGTLPVHPVAADPAGLVEGVLAAVRPVLQQRGFEIEAEIEPAAVPIPVDSDAIQGVLHNLIDNAIKFSSETMRLRIEAGPVSSGYRIAVLDRGIGFDPSKHTRLFERFYRGIAAREGAVPGVGLGLHIAKQVIEAHGGTLEARCRAGGGAVFEIGLPAGDGSSTRMARHD